MILPYKCAHCNKEYMAESREVRRGNARHCSRDCQTASTKLKNESSAGWFNEACAVCKLPLHITETRFKKSSSGLFFCSREHQIIAVSSSSYAVKSGPKPSAPKRRACLTADCKVKTERKDGYCRRCRVNADIQAWLEGDMSKSWVSTTREPKPFVKRYLIETRGDRCEVCGHDEKAPGGRSVIQMDHKDGDYTNNSLDNLQLLCPTHHAMTPNYGILNRSGGRKYRAKYYAKDQ